MTHYNDVLKNPNLKQDDGNWEILSAEELEIFDILVLKKKIWQLFLTLINPSSVASISVLVDGMSENIKMTYFKCLVLSKPQNIQS